MIMIWQGYAPDYRGVLMFPALMLVILSAARISPTDQTRAAWLA